MVTELVVIMAASASWIPVLGLVLGILSGLSVPFILYMLTKRNKEWEALKANLERLDKGVTVLETHMETFAKDRDNRESDLPRLLTVVDQKFELLRNRVEDMQKDLYEKFVTTHQYQRDISAFERFISLLRESIIQQTEILERLK